MSIRSAFLVLFAALAGAPAWATVYELPADGSAVIGSDEHVKSTYQDTLLDIARRYSLGYEEIIRANPGTDLWIPGEGKDVLLPGQRILPPGPHEGIVVNIPEHRLYYYPKPKKNEKPVVITFPVSIGKMDWHTPLGQTHVIQKIKHPAWYPPESVRKEHEANGDPLPKVVPAGPDNPLGDYAMRLAVGDGAYMIHGTNNPMAVGMAVTHGCIRMYPEDVASLFPLIPVGTKVYLINEPVKTAFVDGKLLLEVHPPVDAQGQSTDPDMQLLSAQLDKALGSTTAAIHWDFARQALQAATGMPVVVGLEADNPNAPDAPQAPDAQQSATVPGTMVPGTMVPGTMVPGTMVPGTTAAGTAAATPENPTAPTQSAAPTQAATAPVSDAPAAAGAVQADSAAQTANTTQAAGAAQTANTTQAAGAAQAANTAQAAGAQTAGTTIAAAPPAQR